LSAVHERLHVVHIIAGLERGGAELAMARLVTQLDAQLGIQATVISVGGLGPVAGMLQSAGIEAIPLNIRSILNLPAGAWRLWRHLRRLRPDLVQTWMYHSDLLGGVVASLLGIPVVWGIRTTSLGAGNASTTVLVRWLCARLSPFLPAAAICAATAARLSHERLGYRPRAMHVIPNGVALRSHEWVRDARLAWRQEHGLVETDQVIGWVGRFNPDKDVLTFVKAASAVARQRSDVKMVMVGRGLSRDNQVLGAWLKQEGVEERFFLLGEQAQVDVCYCGFDIFALTSRTEAFPNVLAEAMATSLPCVSTDAGDARTLLGSTGRVVAVGDSNAMANELADLLGHSSARHELAVQARQRIENQFSMSACAGRFAEVYARVCKTKE